MCTLDGRTLHAVDANQALNTVAPTPEVYGSAVDDGFTSKAKMISMDLMFSYLHMASDIYQTMHLLGKIQVFTLFTIPFFRSHSSRW